MKFHYVPSLKKIEKRSAFLLPEAGLDGRVLDAAQWWSLLYNTLQCRTTENTNLRASTGQNQFLETKPTHKFTELLAKSPTINVFSAYQSQGSSRHGISVIDLWTDDPELIENSLVRYMTYHDKTNKTALAMFRVWMHSSLSSIFVKNSSLLRETKEKKKKANPRFLMKCGRTCPNKLQNPLNNSQYISKWITFYS